MRKAARGRYSPPPPAPSADEVLLDQVQRLVAGMRSAQARGATRFLLRLDDFGRLAMVCDSSPEEARLLDALLASDHVRRLVGVFTLPVKLRDVFDAARATARECGHAVDA